MKKIILFMVAAILVVSPLVAAVPTLQSLESASFQAKTTQPASTFTHPVFIELGATTWCSNCPRAAEAIYALYTNNSAYPFYYTTFVRNQEKTSRLRMLYHYGSTSIPTLFFDGGNKTQVGVLANLSQTKQAFRNLINQCGARTIHPLELNTSVVGHNNAKLDITVTVKNTGSSRYIGILKSMVTEIVSRWKDSLGHPYNFAFLSYAIQRIVVLQPQQSKTFTVTWNGAANHGNHTYADINDSNIMVLSTVAHIQPHVIPAIQYVKQHIAFYIDQTSGATVSKD
jgi:hypothetical protein